MQEVVASIGSITFDIEVALEQQLGSQPLPFPGMDKSGSAICNFYLKSVCNKGNACPFRHIKGDRTVVCKHWLRGLCKKGDDCEFLHEYDMSKMPECYFFSKFGMCGNKECPFLHIDPNKKIKDCPWYDRGYCRHGPMCKNRHVRRVMCHNYLCGFCLDGPDCKFVHPRFDIPAMDPLTKAKIASVLCHYCGETGHKLIACPKLPQGVNLTQLGLTPHLGKYGTPGPPSHSQQGAGTGQPPKPGQDMDKFHHPFNTTREPRSGPKRPLEEVTCFKCGGKGHYANRCPKGHLAFLSNPATIARPPAEQPAS